MGPRDQWYLNHRTGKIADLSGVNPRRPYLVDLNYDGLVRYICPSVLGPDVSTFSPPFSLLFDNDDTPGLWLRRCGEEQEETLSRCRSALCVTPQLGSRYVTWAEHELVLAYLPRIERRVPIGRAGGLNRYSAVEAVVHTCNRVFAQWAHTVYVARFEPRRGAPPCQAGG